ESGGDAEEVANRLGTHTTVKTTVEFAARDSMERGEENFHRVGYVGVNLRRDPVQFAAVASGEHYRFFEDSLAAQLVGRMQSLLRRERYAFAELDRRRPVVAADQRDLNSR